jgi:hypothetical protein
MDGLTAAAFEMVAANQNPQGLGQAAAPGSPGSFDIAHFNNLYASAGQTPSAAAEAPKVSQSESQGFRSVAQTLQSLNGGAETLGNTTFGAGAARPGDMLMMTMKAQEFLFHCELTSNVANRTSEGVQQLFSEQS